MDFSGRAATLFFSVIFFNILIAGCGEFGDNRPLPAEKPEAVVKRFYELVSEAGIRGGTIPIKEAYKMISPQSQMHRSRFIGIIKKYPTGFKVDVVGSKVSKKERRAVVTVEYKMASSFGSGYTVNTDLYLLVDEESDAWKIDFTGESDDQDIASLKKVK